MRFYEILPDDFGIQCSFTAICAFMTSQVSAGADEPSENLLGSRKLRSSGETLPAVGGTVRRCGCVASQRGPHLVHAGEQVPRGH